MPNAVSATCTWYFALPLKAGRTSALRNFRTASRSSALVGRLLGMLKSPPSIRFGTHQAQQIQLSLGSAAPDDRALEHRHVTIQKHKSKKQTYQAPFQAAVYLPE